MKNPLSAHWSLSLLGVLSLCVSGCNDSKHSSEASAPGAVAADAASETPASSETSTALSAARSDLKSGHVDQAAAKLAALRVNQASFDAQQAKDFRQAMSDAYDQAEEAASKGDPKAQAAIQLLRSAAPR
jgi:hypothetical protein